RSDLYYRLAVLEVRLPPLRERHEDLPLLVKSILDRLGASARPEAALVRTEEFLASLGRHAWPGNIRQLRNYVERCLAMREPPPVVPVAPPIGARGPDVSLPLRAAKEALERAYLVEILRRHDDNVSAAARAAGVDRIHFYRLLWRHGLR